MRSEALGSEQSSIVISAPLSGSSLEVLEEIRSIHSTLQNAGIQTRTHTQKGLEILLSLDEEQRQQILTGLREWNGILEGSKKKWNPVQTKVSFKDETRMADALLAARSLSMKDDWGDTDDNLLIEIYNHEGVQIHRSQNFFDNCGYSILDLNVQKWQALWKRPQIALEKMGQVVGDLFAGKLSSSKVNIEPHLILEIFNETSAEPFYPKAIKVTFKDIYPVYSPTGAIAGFVVTSLGEVVSTGPERLKFGCI